MKKKITKRFYKEPRVEIVRILVDELSKLKSAKAITTEELLNLADKLAKIIK